MYFVDEIKYAGDNPPKAIVPGGYLNVLIAEDVPVTNLRVGLFLAKFRGFTLPDMRATDPVRGNFSIDFHNNQNREFIGESMLLHDLLLIMLRNSIEAGATHFHIDIHTADDEMRFLVSDNGRGVAAGDERKIIREWFTTKSTACGSTMWNAAREIEKIGASASYSGTGWNGTGASFTIKLLTKMPNS